MTTNTQASLNVSLAVPNTRPFYARLTALGFGMIALTGLVVLGVSLDDELSHERFAQKYSLPFPLLSDKDAAVSRRYGTYKEKSLYGRSFWGIERTTFVIDREGKVEHVFRRVKVEGHAEEVMATLAL